jgi:hypothetical protein
VWYLPKLPLKNILAMPILLGQTILISGDAIPAMVTGVMKDIPENSQIKADMLLSMSTLTQKFNKGIEEQWGNYGATTYLLLKPGVNAKTLQAKFPAFMENVMAKKAAKANVCDLIAGAFKGCLSSFKKGRTRSWQH